MSPTIPSRLAVRWLRLCSYHREERVLGRLATLARTSLLLPRHRTLMKDNILGMLAPPLFTRERQAGAAPSRIYHSNREKSVSSLSHILSSTGKLVAMYSHKRKSIRDPKRSQELHSERERENGFSPNMVKFAIFMKYEQIMPSPRKWRPSEEQVPLA